MGISPADTRSAARVLVVDDERPIREMLELGLTSQGFDVRAAADGQAALAVVRDWRPEVVVLDIMMPKIDGLTLISMLRRISEAPILLLSAMGELEHRVAGLDSGADDYLAKPFDMAELVSRLRSALRRPRLQHVESITYADMEVEIQARTVRRGQRLLDLSSLEYALLLTLLRHPRRVFTREQLLNVVWGSDAEVGPGNVDRYVSYLRAKVDVGDERRLIHTIRGVGYSLYDD